MEALHILRGQLWHKSVFPPYFYLKCSKKEILMKSLGAGGGPCNQQQLFSSTCLVETAEHYNAVCGNKTSCCILKDDKVQDLF